jgi:hypothetical protein
MVKEFKTRGLSSDRNVAHRCNTKMLNVIPTQPSPQRGVADQNIKLKNYNLNNNNELLTLSLRHSGD